MYPAAGLMALSVGYLAGRLLASYPPGGTGERFLFLIAATLAGAVVYLAVALLVGSTEPREFVRLRVARRGRRPDPALP